MQTCRSVTIYFQSLSSFLDSRPPPPPASPEALPHNRLHDAGSTKAHTVDAQNESTQINGKNHNRTKGLTRTEICQANYCRS